MPANRLVPDDGSSEVKKISFTIIIMITLSKRKAYEKIFTNP